MRVQILSDLHVDAGGRHRPKLAADVDVLVVAGDVCAGVGDAFRVLRHAVPMATPIMMVLGNHEFYGSGLGTELVRAQAGTTTHNIHVLENAAVVLGGTRFVGATLWTDYDLFGPDNRDTCIQAAQASLNDHRLIGLTTGGSADRRFKPVDARALHQQTRDYLDRALAAPHPGPTVVITHHAPHENSVARRFNRSPLTGAFVSDLAAVINTHQPALWIHGHTHTSFDYRVGATRVICNPAGYGSENPEFDPALVVEV